MMWDYYHKHQQKRNHDFRKYENMMRHDRRHKGGAEADHVFIMKVSLIMNALIILYTILDDVII